MIKKIFALCSVLFALCAGGANAATLINDTEVESVLYELVEPLADAAQIPHGRLKIHIVNDDDFNAFVRGGEDVYVYTGLLMQIKSHGALQAVIAHELGHTLGGHMVQMSARMDAEMTRTLIVQALGIGLMVAGGNPSLGAGVLAGSAGIAQQSMLAFSRDEERSADNLGVDLMVRAGLNPMGFVEVFEQMRDMTEPMESRINPNRVNHPLTTERLKNIRDTVKKINAEKKFDTSKDAKYSADYANIRAKLVGYLTPPERVRELYPSSDKSVPAIYARAIANMQRGNLSVAKVGAGTLISRSPNNPYYYELLGDIEYQYGHYDDSVAAYERSIELSKNAPQIQTALALVLTERNKPGDKTLAIDMCKRALLREPAPLTYWVLSLAYSPDARADWAMAEYYNMLNKKDKVHEYAKRAQKNLPKNSPEYIKSGDLLN